MTALGILLATVGACAAGWSFHAVCAGSRRRARAGLLLGPAGAIAAALGAILAAVPGFLGAALLLLAPGARADESPPLGHRRSAWESGYVQKNRDAVLRFGDEYAAFLTAHKTERDFARAALAAARAAGWKPLAASAKLAPGDRVYASLHDKAVALAVIGRRPLADGVRVVAAHLDAVRIDLKPNPVYADANLALLQTHYYGGLKKYHWLSLPLELRGVIVRRDGSSVEVRLGADPKDPVLVIPDLAKQLSPAVDKEEGEDVPGEALDPVIASTPLPGPAGATKGDSFELHALKLLADRYRVSAEDLRAAELELVPAQPARSVGLDGALVGGYGQDGRACAWAALRAALAVERPEHTAIVLLVDKEEIGNTGATSAQSPFLARAVGDLLAATGADARGDQAVRELFARSLALSADATTAAHPQYRALFEKRNASFLGAGPSWDQTGAATGLAARLRKILDGAGVAWQTGAFSRVLREKSEEGTMLPFLAALGIDAMNLSIPVMSMHAPFELVSKADLHEAWRAYRAFLSE